MAIIMADRLIERTASGPTGNCHLAASSSSSSFCLLFAVSRLLFVCWLGSWLVVVVVVAAGGAFLSIFRDTLLGRTNKRRLMWFCTTGTSEMVQTSVVGGQDPHWETSGPQIRQPLTEVWVQSRRRPGLGLSSQQRRHDVWKAQGWRTAFTRIHLLNSSIWLGCKNFFWALALGFHMRWA